MKLEVGMYVRTKNGYIRKIDRIWNDKDFNVNKIYYNNNIDEDTLGCVLDEDIKGKPTFNIKDLIEVGDYVNGLPVCINYWKSDNKWHLEIPDSRFISKIPLEQVNIQSIVTKEQFESMSYKVDK